MLERLQSPRMGGIGAGYESPTGLDKAVAASGSGHDPHPPRLQPGLRHFPRRDVLHRLRPAPRLGLCRPATAHSVARGVVLCVVRRSPGLVPRCADARDCRDGGDGGGVRPRDRGQPLRPMARRALRAGSRGFRRHRPVVHHRHLPNGGLAWLLLVPCENRADQGRTLVARHRYHRGGDAARQVHDRLLPGGAGARTSGDTAAALADAAVGVSGRFDRGSDDPAQRVVAAGARLAVPGIGRGREKRQEHRTFAGRIHGAAASVVWPGVGAGMAFGAVGEPLSSQVQGVPRRADRLCPPGCDFRLQSRQGLLPRLDLSHLVPHRRRRDRRRLAQWRWAASSLCRSHFPCSRKKE